MGTRDGTHVGGEQLSHDVLDWLVWQTDTNKISQSGPIILSDDLRVVLSSDSECGGEFWECLTFRVVDGGQDQIELHCVPSTVSFHSDIHSL